jgi:intracellular sulfur oxidation DsrE/DsrF family protein
MLLATAQTNDSAVTRKVVIQVSSAEESVRNTAMSNAKNLLQASGEDKISVIVVAYGPGLGLLEEGSAQASRIEDLVTKGVEFDACGNTIKKRAKQGNPPVLVSGVQVVDTGVGRIVDLQVQGYAYIRP